MPIEKDKLTKLVNKTYQALGIKEDAARNIQKVAEAAKKAAVTSPEKKAG